MIICPKCGFEPAPIWKNRRFQLYQRYARIDELEAWPDTKPIAAILRELGPTKQSHNKVTYSDGIYNYQYREDHIVVRIPKKLARNPNSMREPPKETHRHRIHWLPLSQKKLEDFLHGEPVLEDSEFPETG